MKINSLAGTLTIAAALTLVPGLFASDDHDSRGACSNDTLRGHYATLIQGAYGPGITPGTQTSGPSTPFQGIQMLQFDGKGNITGTEQLVAGGYVVTQDENAAPTFVPVTGTYKINKDCTGSAYISSSHNGVAANFVYVGMVLANAGKTFYMLVVSPYDGAATPDAPGVVRPSAASPPGWNSRTQHITAAFIKLRHCIAQRKPPTPGGFFHARPTTPDTKLQRQIDCLESNLDEPMSKSSRPCPRLPSSTHPCRAECHGPARPGLDHRSIRTACSRGSGGGSAPNRSAWREAPGHAPVP